MTRGERGADRAPLAVLQRDRRGREHGADQSEPGDQLGSPGECRHRRDGCDAGRENECDLAWNEVVQSGGREQRCVPAGDPCSGRCERGVHRSVRAVQPEAGTEDEERSERAEADPLDGADPAAVHGEHEEEDDPQERHDPARPGERLRAEEVVEGHVAVQARGAEPLVPGRAQRLGRRSLGWGGGGGRRRRRDRRR